MTAGLSPCSQHPRCKQQAYTAEDDHGILFELHKVDHMVAFFGAALAKPRWRDNILKAQHVDRVLPHALHNGQQPAPLVGSCPAELLGVVRDKFDGMQLALLMALVMVPTRAKHLTQRDRADARQHWSRRPFR